MASITQQKMLTEVLWESIGIDASDPEDTMMMATMMVAWVTGSVLISNTNFMAW